MGVNVQPGQEFLLYAELDQPEFVDMVVEEAYEAGAGKVIVEWRRQQLIPLHNRYQTEGMLGKVEAWEQARLQHMTDTLPCQVSLLSADPDGLRGMDMKKHAAAQQRKHAIVKPYQDKMENWRQWCVAAVPGKAWAKKVFPGWPEEEALEELWKAILAAARVEGDPVANWNAHNEDLKARCRYLNSLQIAKLRYRADNGTDLQVGLIPESRFCGGGETSRQGIFFNPNIPTEECFTTPMRGNTEGIVYSTKPFSYRGRLINDFSIRFEKGKAVEVRAEQGQELLETMIHMDEGAAYLGECALVPQNSPIARSGLLFYNTLFDENAACHLALGRGYMDCMQDFTHKTVEECRALGVNDSMIHEDFMIGCDSLDIDAVTATGSIVPLFRQGNWAF